MDVPKNRKIYNIIIVFESTFVCILEEMYKKDTMRLICLKNFKKLHVCQLENIKSSFSSHVYGTPSRCRLDF